MAIPSFPQRRGTPQSYKSKEVVRFKKADDVEVHIDGMGDPGAYPQLVEGAKTIRGVAVVFMQTRLYMLDERKIRRLTEAGALRVGPMSAGADPGPVCYGLGGTEPTVTDANVVLGRVASLLGGEMRLDAEAAFKAFKKLGDPVETAWRVVQLANMEMARAVRLVTVERGLDPGEFVLFAFGGAGPQHAAELAEELGISTVVIPPEPGVFTALGMLFADSKFEARVSYPRDLEEGFRRLEETLSVHNPTYYVRLADVRYVGQGWELVVPVGRPADEEQIKETFEERHKATYGFKLDKPIEVVTIRVFAIVTRRKPKLREPPAEGEPKPASFRKVYFGEWVETPVYRRENLPRGFKADGPVVIEERHSATLVPPRWRVEVGKMGVLELRRI